MKQELDEALCAKYPKIFKDRHGDMRTTAMCWGIAVGDGWYNILDQLCGNIQHHIDWKIKQRGWAIENKTAHDAGYDACLKLAQGASEFPSEWDEKRAMELSINNVVVPEEPSQVIATQVKEKIGTLRFYYDGGDDYISGMVSLAESLTAVTCEECGSPGKQRGGGWIRTLCDVHEAEHQERIEQRNKNV